MSGGQGQDAIKIGFEAPFVDFERGVVPCVAPRRLFASHSDEVAHSGGETPSPSSMTYWVSRRRWARQT